jgi:hypothetical protein
VIEFGASLQASDQIAWVVCFGKERAGGWPLSRDEGARSCRVISAT